MKSSTFAGITLTLLMLLLVLGAAFLFLWQGRESLNEQVELLSDDLAVVEATATESAIVADGVRATATAVAATLATVEAESVLLEGQLVDSQQEVDAMANQIATLEASLATAQAQLAVSGVPSVTIISPPADALLSPEEPVERLVVVTDLEGITAVNLTIADQTIGSYTVDDQTVFVARQEWIPPAEGSYTLSVMAVNSRGIAAEPVSVNFQVLDVTSRNTAIRHQVEQNVSELRGLELLAPIEPTVLTRDELRARIEEDFAAESSPEEARKDTLVLAAFDLLDRNFDLYSALVDLQSEAILGFYDPETAEFVVVTDENLLDASAQWTHAHEVMHVLQDQHFHLDLISSDELDSEAKAALRALAEGEAQLVQFLYITQGYFTDAQVEEVFASLEEQDDAVLDQVPQVLIDNLSFPYTAGFEFVLALYQQGGSTFSLVDAAWENLPQSTEQILHPDRYFAGDEPQIVSLPPLTDTLGVGWELLEEDILGEFFLREYLSQQLTEGDTDRAATGWGGDKYAVYWQPETESLAMVLRIVFDTPRDFQEFAAVYPDYPAGLFGVEGERRPDGGMCWVADEVICFYGAEQEGVIVRAPDVETAVLLANAIIQETIGISGY